MSGCRHLLFSGSRCPGQVLQTGYCDACGRRERRGSADGHGRPRRPGAERTTAGQAGAGRQGAAQAGAAQAGAGQAGAAQASAGQAEDGLLALPYLPDTGTTGTALPREGSVPPEMRWCTDCGVLIPSLLVPGPVPDTGHCPGCGLRFDFRLPLRPGELLGGQYRVLGPLAYGGQGSVYLAEDLHLDRSHVAVKGLLNRHDETMVELAEKERNYLIGIRHPSIVGIRDYVRHTSPDDGGVTHYIVMEYAGSHTLEEVVVRTRRGERPLGRPFDVEHAVTYGYRILLALSHLHVDRHLAYMDMKPRNVMHDGKEIRIIDLGGVRELGDATWLTVSPWYTAPEVGATGPTVAHDLFTVGRTLQLLTSYARCDAPGLGVRSLDLLLARATHHVPGLRFGSAQEMADQLRGVLREIRALRGKHDTPEPSQYFRPSSDLLGRDLGAVRPIAHWLSDRHSAPSRRSGPRAEHLDPGVPTALEVALGLPVPAPAPDDPQAGEPGSVAYSPDQTMQQKPGERSAEVHFHNMRRLLRLKAPDEAGARRELDAAAGTPYPPASLRWRLDWHRGLLALVRAHHCAEGGDRAGERRALATAWDRFWQVYEAVPGEYAPKLALAYCAERTPARPGGDADGDPAHGDLPPGGPADGGPAPGDRPPGSPADGGPAAADASGHTAADARWGDGPAASATLGGGPPPPRSRPTAEQLYDAVWRRNRSHGSAAFGLARTALARGDWAAAVRVLGRVEDSRDYAAARIARLRVRAAWLAAGAGPPTAADLRETFALLDDLLADPALAPLVVEDRGRQLRLRIEVLEWVLVALSRMGERNRAAGGGPGATGDAAARRGAAASAVGALWRDGPASSLPLVIREVRTELEGHFRQLARRESRRDDRARLADWANAVRPTTLT